MNQGIKELRYEKKLSQNDLAEKLNVSVQTIRNWEKHKSIPPIEYMSFLANELGVHKEDIIKIFETNTTRVEDNRKKEIERYKSFVELFWGVDSIDKLITFSWILSDLELNGVVYDKDYLFPFSKVIANKEESGLVLTDSENNCMAFTPRNVKSAKALSDLYDVYTFELIMSCHMFPNIESEKTSDNKLKISIYNKNR